MFPQMYFQNVICQQKTLTKLISDFAQVEISKKVQNILRYLFIDDWQSEPYHQHQNSAKRKIQDIKRLANRLLDRTGNFPELWLLAMQYAAYVLNHILNPQFDHNIPLQVLTSVTQNISALLRFH